jgi:aminoglycoside N3'-acetyltransferase
VDDVRDEQAKYKKLLFRYARPSPTQTFPSTTFHYSYLRSNDRFRAKYTYTVLMHKLNELYALLADVVVQFHAACASAAGGVTYPLLMELFSDARLLPDNVAIPF